MKKGIIWGFMLMFSLTSYAQSNVCGDFNCPSGDINDNNKLLQNELYVMSYDIENKMPDWAFYSFTSKYYSDKGKRVWKSNPNLKDSEQLEPKDYKSAYAELKTDRGHFVPLYTFAGHPNYKILNYLTNISPQKYPLNRGVWLQIEKFERSLINKSDVEKIHVFVGSYYDDSLDMKLPKADESHDIPDGYWKTIIIENKNKEYGYISYIMSQTPEKKVKFCKFQESMENIREKVGMDFDIESMFSEKLNNKLAGYASARCK